MFRSLPQPTRNPAHQSPLCRLVLTLASTTCLLAVLLPVAMADPSPDPKPAAPRSLVSLTEAEAAKLPPMTREIRSVQLHERDQLVELTDRLKKVPNDAEALLLQLRVAVVKQRAEIDIMEIQARHATVAGHHNQAEAILAAVADLKKQLAVPADPEGGEQ